MATALIQAAVFEGRKQNVAKLLALFRVRLLPRSHIPRFVEDSCVIVHWNLARKLRAELLPEWVPTS